jgi:hypothetical protein
MPVARNEAQIILAMQAMERDRKISLGEAAKAYSVPYNTLKRRRHGILPRGRNHCQLSEIRPP